MEVGLARIFLFNPDQGLVGGVDEICRGCQDKQQSRVRRLRRGDWLRPAGTSSQEVTSIKSIFGKEEGKKGYRNKTEHKVLPPPTPRLLLLVMMMTSGHTS